MVITAKKVYKEDISTLAAGTELVSSPCVVYSVVATIEADGDAIINFSNSATSYSTTYRCLKLVTCAEHHTVTATFPNGMACSTGLCATSNVGGVDISVTYE